MTDLRRLVESPETGVKLAPAAPHEPAAAHSEKGSSFYLGFLFLPKPKREALTAVYGFCRRMDDIVDDGRLSPDGARKELEGWREEIEQLFKGKPKRPMSELLLPHVERFHLPKKPFLDLIDGVEMDLNKKRYDTFEELEPYLYGVAVTVGQLCVEIFGHEHTSPDNLREYCKNMGNAFQLTNILRDVGADLEFGRVYLPKQDIEKAGYSLEALMRREHNPSFRSLMNAEYERAKTFYKRARNCLDPKDRPAMLSAEIMARVYEGVLDEIKALDYHVFFHRVRLSGWRKARLAVRAILYSYGIV